MDNPFLTFVERALDCAAVEDGNLHFHFFGHRVRDEVAECTLLESFGIITEHKQKLWRYAYFREVIKISNSPRSTKSDSK